MKEAGEKERTNLSNNTGASASNISNSNINTQTSASNYNMQIPVYPSYPPQMFYYQPFRPQGCPMNPIGIYPPPPQPYGYMNMNPYQQSMAMPIPIQRPPHYPIAFPTEHSAPVHPVAARPAAQKAVNIQSTAAVRPPKPQNQPPKTKKPQITPQTTAVSSYNLDDPEELEKWKAERRKKFPSAKKEVEASNPVETKEKVESKEDGAFSETDETEENVAPSLKRKRTCKYFTRGKCTKGDSCPFDHVSAPQKSKLPNTTTTSSSTSRPTIFENLLKIEEKGNMIKFYECIKLIIKK